VVELLKASKGHTEPTMSVKIKSKTQMLTIKLTEDQQRLIDQKAKMCGVKRSVWMRSILTQAASRKAMQGYLRIREPDGVTS
jgi:uncharacterized protein (DUF1778 family)